MKIVIACNAFKDSLTSVRAGRIIARAFRRAMPDVEIGEVPIADGGDGTLDCIAAAVPAKRVRKKVPGPLFEPLTAEYLLIDNGGAAVVEMARASGLALLRREERDTVRATTLGAGLLIRDAAARGCEKIIVGIGGSATTDGGMGAASALGYVFRDARGRALQPCGANLARIKSIDTSGVSDALKNIEITVACDVTNPLLGPGGAAYMYAPQKGASPAQVRQLEAGLKNLADVAARDLGKDFRRTPGAGAAGGLGFGLMTFLNARLVSGIDMMMQATDLERRLKGAGLLITGEGRMDAQSAQGKAPFGLLRIAKKHGVPVIAFVGAVQDEPALCRAGFRAVIPIVSGPMPLDDAIANAADLLSASAFRTARLMVLK
jgi:glycerate kinase